MAIYIYLYSTANAANSLSLVASTRVWLGYKYKQAAVARTRTARPNLLTRRVRTHIPGLCTSIYSLNVCACVRTYVSGSVRQVQKRGAHTTHRIPNKLFIMLIMERRTAAAAPARAHTPKTHWHPIEWCRVTPSRARVLAFVIISCIPVSARRAIACAAYPFSAAAAAVVLLTRPTSQTRCACGILPVLFYTFPNGPAPLKCRRARALFIDMGRLHLDD